MIKMNFRLCEACGTCIGVCPVDAISMGKATAIIDMHVCIDCEACARVCPVRAISILNENEELFEAAD